MDTIVIYHGGCDDGFAAAYVIWSRNTDTPIEFYPGAFYTPPPDVKGKDVIMVDFAYDFKTMQQIQADSRSLVWIDHHIGAIRNNAELKPRIGLDMFTLDTTKCGAMLMFEHIYGRHRGIPGLWLRRFIEYINDRDMWERKLPDSDAFTAALRTYPQDFEVWDGIANAAYVGQLIAEGKPILKAFNVNVAMLCKQAYNLNIAGTVVPVVNTNRIYCSEVAGEIAIGKPFGATWEYRGGMYVFSLRSDENGMDVSEVAQKFPGGGGHKRSAGFSVTDLKDLNK